mmetsp:Transcript_83745/g.232101  ORF Transcript_83745/g.232101 Transcript_83745/m.232101 type:complete len:202 (-) Transcript_83745:728-1333(-)
MPAGGAAAPGQPKPPVTPPTAGPPAANRARFPLQPHRASGLQLLPRCAEVREGHRAVLPEGQHVRGCQAELLEAPAQRGPLGRQVAVCATCRHLLVGHAARNGQLLVRLRLHEDSQGAAAHATRRGLLGTLDVVRCRLQRASGDDLQALADLEEQRLARAGRDAGLQRLALAVQDVEAGVLVRRRDRASLCVHEDTRHEAR